MTRSKIKALLLICFIFSFGTVRAQLLDTFVLSDKFSVLFASDESEPLDDQDFNWNYMMITAKVVDSISLEGHTDEVGSLDYNQKLSKKRVESVRRRFEEAEVDASKIFADYFGESRPEDNGRSEEAYQQNRRVVIRYFKKEKRRLITGRVTDKDSKLGLNATILLTGKNFKDSIETDKEGKYSILAPAQGIFKIEASAKDYFFAQKFIKLSAEESAEFDLQLPKIALGRAYRLPNFNFKGDQPILLDSSVPTLDQLYNMLADSDVCIEIEGHINLPNRPPCEKESWHYKLSSLRASMVLGAMVERGIDASRMLPQAYGNWHMLFPKATTEKEMKENRRVQVKIIKCDNEDLLDYHHMDK